MYTRQAQSLLLFIGIPVLIRKQMDLFFLLPFRFEANIDFDGTNHYSVPNRRASQAFNDPDELFLDRNSNAVDQCCAEEAPPNLYANSSSLSSSYDERLFHKDDRCTVATENISTADSYDKSSIGSNSILSCNDSSYQIHMNCDLSKQDKYLHSHSENSLHRQRNNSLLYKIEHLHISEPELNINTNACEGNIPKIHNVSLTRKSLRPTSTILPANTSDYSSNQIINHSIELSPTPISFQECKRTSASGCLEYVPSKPKTKEWIETSLDSPLVSRKRKPKQLDCPQLPEQIQPVQWLENGLPTVVPESYSGHQNQTKYEDGGIKYRKCPSPLPHHYNSADNHREYRTPKVPYSSQERIYVNSNHLAPDSCAYHDYENTPEILKNLVQFSPRHSNSHGNYNFNYKNVVEHINEDSATKCAHSSPHGNYNLNYKNTVEDINEETPSSPKLNIAEPQKPSKHQNRRINVGDVFPPDSIPCINEPDYQNIAVDNQYEPVNFRECSLIHGNSSYSQLQSDSAGPNQYPHNHSYESQTMYRNTCASPSTETWQQSVAPTPTETAAVSPVSQTINFSPSIEVDVVSVGHYQPYWEETKPYELSDFYKYSTKHRKQQKNSTSDSVDSQSLVEKENIDVNRQFYEQIPSASVVYREFQSQGDGNCASNVVPSKQHQVTSHVPVFGCSEQLESPAQ